MLKLGVLALKHVFFIAMQAMHTAFGSGGHGALFKAQQPAPQPLMQRFYALHAQVLQTMLDALHNVRQVMPNRTLVHHSALNALRYQNTAIFAKITHA